MPKLQSRRELLRAGLGGAAAIANTSEIATIDAPPPVRGVLTPADRFIDVSRGTPVPHSLPGEALINARLTPDTWRLEVVGEGGANVPKPLTLQDGSALDLSTLMNLGKTRSVKFLKAVQCLNIAQPLGQGLWEGVPLRDVLLLTGTFSSVRRIYYWGFHNDDPKQIFQSSLSLTQVMETPPWELPAFLAYRLNGKPLPLERGGPVRILIPWAHGFKSIKWLHRIALTNDYRANDTYAEANNDPESHLKTAAYLDSVPNTFPNNKPILIRGTVISGLSGLKRVEYWLRRVSAFDKPLSDNDPAWETAKWIKCPIDASPSDWRHTLPPDVRSTEIWGFDKITGNPKEWPLRYGMTGWTANVGLPPPGKYELRARAVDLNGFAQPEPRANRQTGLNGVEVRQFEVIG
ncbi:MAG: molybdopterin-dependent oxidoreductase [Armatimonadetes bacterium]|nr:molybdopterin-dependent oxidoreductase [Armatimonadota bacterium]